jgi:hypothetical protein
MGLMFLLRSLAMSEESFKQLRKRMRDCFEEDNYLFNNWVFASGRILHQKGYIKDIAEAEKAAQELLIKAFGMEQDGISSDEDEFV